VVGAARAMVYVSNFEGFGVPIIEAMNCGVPVITSTTTAMPEVAGDAALLVDPSNPEAIAEAMTLLVNDPELCKKLSEAGRTRSVQFTWSNTSERLWMSVIRAVSGR
jgi:glycosyltransferase involved in cell wall biosynthesis